MFLLIFIIFELKGKVTITMIIQKSIILLDEIWTKFFLFLLYIAWMFIICTYIYHKEQ